MATTGVAALIVTITWFDPEAGFNNPHTSWRVVALLLRVMNDNATPL